MEFADCAVHPQWVYPEGIARNKCYLLMDVGVDSRHMSSTHCHIERRYPILAINLKIEMLPSRWPILTHPDDIAWTELAEAFRRACDAW